MVFIVMLESPLQNYAMPFLHSLSTWTQCSLPPSFSRTVLPFHYSEGYRLPSYRPPDSTLWRTAVFHEPYKPNYYRSATGLTVPVLYRQSVFLSLLTWHPAPLICHNLPCLLPSYSFMIATVQCESDTQFFTIITTELKAIGIPALGAFLHRYSAFMFPLRPEGLSCNHMSAYRWWYQGCVLTLPHPQSNHIYNDVYSAYYQMFSSIVPVAHETRPEYGLLGLFLVHWQQGSMRYPFSRLSISPASLRISTSMVFLLSNSCNSFICYITAASFEAGTKSSPAATVVRLPSIYCFFLLNNKLGWISCKRTIWDTVMPGYIVCWIMAIFSWVVLRIRSSCPSKVSVISKLELVLDIYPSLSLILRYIHCLAF